MMKTKYEKINKQQVLDMLIRIHLDLINPTDIISVPNIAYLLETSEYQVRKYINELRKDGFVEVGIIPAYTYGEEFSLPIKGFHITDKVKELKEYKIAKEKEIEIRKEVFGI